MIHNHIPIKDTRSYSFAINKLRSFFLEKGFFEVHTQDRLSILAACEDPDTVATYEYGGQVWPLPQTGQMWLEYELLSNPDLNGVFCVSTSYRNEPNPIPGRHETIFPMFEFESKGTLDDLRQLEIDLCTYLGFGDSFVHKTYDELSKKYGTDDLTSENEFEMEKEYGKVVFLEHFPETEKKWKTCKQDRCHHAWYGNDWICGTKL